jgi:hypothetical protein
MNRTIKRFISVMIIFTMMLSTNIVQGYDDDEIIYGNLPPLIGTLVKDKPIALAKDSNGKYYDQRYSFTPEETGYYDVVLQSDNYFKDGLDFNAPFWWSNNLDTIYKNGKYMAHHAFYWEAGEECQFSVCPDAEGDVSIVIIEYVEQEKEITVDPLYLNGDGTGHNSMIGSFMACNYDGTPTDYVRTLTKVSFNDMIPDLTYDEGNYRYLVLTYTGNISKLFLIFSRNNPVGVENWGEDEVTFYFDTVDKPDTVWDTRLVSYDGSEIPVVGNNTTIIIDLKESINELSRTGTGKGLDIDYYNTAVELLGQNMATDGTGITISQAYLTREIEECTVSVDGNAVDTVIKGCDYTIPNGTVGYYVNGKLYGPGMKYTVTEDVDFTELKLNVNIGKSADIKYTRPAALRFKSKLTCNNEEILSNVLKETGTLITKSDYVDNIGELNLSSKYSFASIKCSGWQDSEFGKYYATLAGIKSKHNFLDYRARAYATVQYADGSTRTVYSTCTNPCSVAEASYKIIKNNAVYNGLSDDYKEILNENME